MWELWTTQITVSVTFVKKNSRHTFLIYVNYFFQVLLDGLVLENTLRKHVMIPHTLSRAFNRAKVQQSQESDTMLAYIWGDIQSLYRFICYSKNQTKTTKWYGFWVKVCSSRYKEGQWKLSRGWEAALWEKTKKGRNFSWGGGGGGKARGNKIKMY